MNNVKCILGICTFALVFAAAAARADPNGTSDRERPQILAAAHAGSASVIEPQSTPRDMFPWVVPQAPSTAPAKTRAPVMAELIAARHNGELPVGEPEIAPRDMFPWLYPSQTSDLPMKTREQVQAEAAAAAKAGSLPASFVARSERALFPGAYRPSEASRSLAHSAARSHAN